MTCSCLLYGLKGPGAPYMFAVYAFPDDYANRYVVRRWMAYQGQPVPELIPWAVERSLEAARREIPPGLFRSPRQRGDDRAIVETWL